MSFFGMTMEWDEADLPRQQTQVLDQDIEDALTILERHGTDPNWFKVVQDLNRLLLQ